MFKAPAQEWTIATVLEHLLELRGADQKAIERALEAADTQTAQALVAADRAVGKAEAAAEKRFDSVNEFRDQLRDQAATFMPRAEAEQRIAQLDEKIRDLVAAGNQARGRSEGWGHLVGWASAAAAVAYVVANNIAK